MPYLFLAAAVVAIAAFASLKFTVSLFFCIALITVVVKIVASKFIGAPVSLGAAAKSVVWACILPTLVLLALLILFKGKVGTDEFTGTLLFTILFASFAFGFKHVLNATFNASMSIALISTVVAGVLLFVLRPLLF